MQDAGPHPFYHVKNGILLWKSRLMVPTNSTLIETILEEFHSSILVGHSGIARTKARVAAQFFWSSLASDVRKFVQIAWYVKRLNLPHLLLPGYFNPYLYPLSYLGRYIDGFYYWLTTC